MFKQYKLKNYKFILIALVVILNTIGVALVGSASPGDQKKQIIGMVSGIIIMLLVSYIDYNFILRFSWLIYLGARRSSGACHCGRRAEQGGAALV